MDSFSDVIDALGVSVVASILGIAENHARTLKARNSIPPGYFRRLVESEPGKERGITFDLLHRLLDEAAERRTQAAPADEGRAA